MIYIFLNKFTFKPQTKNEIKYLNVVKIQQFWITRNKKWNLRNFCGHEIKHGKTQMKNQKKNLFSVKLFENPNKDEKRKIIKS